MPEMTFYMMTPDKYSNICAASVDRLIDLIDVICNQGDSVKKPNDFYYATDNDGRSFNDYLSDDQVKKDSLYRLFIKTIFQQSDSDKTLDELKRIAINENGILGFIKDNRDYSSELIDYIATDKNTLKKVYRIMLYRFVDYSELQEWCSRAYPKLLFTEDAFTSSDKMGRFSENIGEINTVLSTLNDYGNESFRGKSEADALRSLQSICGISCSGKGANEHSSFKKKVLYQDQQGEIKKYDISCIPHFKLDTAYSNKRVYFCWGRDEINNHAIIVVHVGEHWNDLVNKQLALII